MNIEYRIVKAGSKRNQPYIIEEVFTGTKKECKDKFEIIVNSDKDHDYFVGQYMEGELNKVILNTEK